MLLFFTCWHTLHTTALSKHIQKVSEREIERDIKLLHDTQPNALFASRCILQFQNERRKHRGKKIDDRIKYFVAMHHLAHPIRPFTRLFAHLAMCFMCSHSKCFINTKRVYYVWHTRSHLVNASDSSVMQYHSLIYILALFTNKIYIFTFSANADVFSLYRQRDVCMRHTHTYIHTQTLFRMFEQSGCLYVKHNMNKLLLTFFSLDCCVLSWSLRLYVYMTTACVRCAHGQRLSITIELSEWHIFVGCCWLLLLLSLFFYQRWNIHFPLSVQSFFSVAWFHSYYLHRGISFT